MQQRKETNRHSTKEIAFFGVFLAFALILSYIESLIPFYFGIPGAKLGLPNLIIVMMLYCVGAKEALTLSVLRIVLSGFLFGNLFSILYSLAGGLLSFLLMVLVKKTDQFGVIAVSVVGGISHNIGQILVASLIVKTFQVLYYGPMLLIAGILTGFLIGILAQELIVRLKKMF
ncbi:MAG: Gx transporter family protein [Lachnospiraceae bacterium]